MVAADPQAAKGGASCLTHFGASSQVDDLSAAIDRILAGDMVGRGWWTRTPEESGTGSGPCGLPRTSEYPAAMERPG